LDTVISEFMKLLTEYPSYYKEMFLLDTASKLLVPIMQETFKKLTLYDPLEQPNRKMEAVSKLKYILLDHLSMAEPPTLYGLHAPIIALKTSDCCT